jgi:peptide/nickel transport system substrate-binding protein
MKSKRTIRLFAVLLALLLTISLAACGGGNGGASGNLSEPDTAYLASETLRVGLPGSIATLDINQAAGIIDYYIAAISQEGLVGVSNDGQLIPALAESWKVSDDGKVWTFKLDEKARFHNGDPVTPEDVLYSAERAQNPEVSPGMSAYFPPYIESAEKTGDNEVTFTLDGPHPGFLWNVSNAGALLISQKAFVEDAASYGSPNDLIIGTGAYKAIEFEPGSHATFEYSAGTWRGEEPIIKMIRLDFITDDNTRLLAFQQGDIDFTYDIPSDQEDQWRGVSGATVGFISNRSYQGLTLNPNIAPFDDEHVRKAFAYAIDTDSIVNGLLNGHAQAATALPAPEQLISELDSAAATALLDTVTHFTFDLDAAKKELALSNTPNGFTAELTYPDSDQNVGKASLAIAESLKQIGITLNVKEIPLEQWLMNVSTGTQGVAWMSYTPTTGEPAEVALWLLYADGESNPAFWSDEDAMGLMDRAYAAASDAEQINLALEANSIAQTQGIYAPVYWGQSGYALGAGVSIEDYNSYTLVANWPSLFAVSR